MFKNKLITLLLLLIVSNSYSQSSGDLDNLELLDDKDINLLLDDDKLTQDLDLSRLEEIDDLEALKNDVGKAIPDLPVSVENKKKLEELKDDKKTLGEQDKKEKTKKKKAVKVFDAGDAEKNLLELAKFVEKKIPADEWDEISTAAKVERYVVQQGDWLWKISQKLFGTGFYYSKIWSMNPQITNPHEIEPGQVLIFDTGSSQKMPEVAFGSFEEDKKIDAKSIKKSNKLSSASFFQYGENISPKWLEDRKKLVNKGAFFQYLTESTYDDILDMTVYELNREYQKYDPPINDLLIIEPEETFDASKINLTTKEALEIKDGFYLNTFLTTNLVQDLGKVYAKRNESVYVQKHEKIYIEFDPSVKVRPGDLFSIYNPSGTVSHSISDRSGYKYSIVAQVKAIKQTGKRWECEVTELSGLAQRGSRVTVYTPKINKIFKTFNKRNVEAAVIGTYKPQANGISFGDVVYLDRGRVDGVELGNVFEVYSFQDRGTGQKIANDPVYKIGEIVVITLTDNFATGLVTQSSVEMRIGSVALSKTQEKALRESKLKESKDAKELGKKEKIGLEELDVELNLDGLSKDLLDQIDDIQINEDELEELERQEREKSIIKEHEKDLKALEKLEKELVDAESKLGEKKLDEDAYLEKQDLNAIEKKQKKKDPNAFESMDEIESEIGKKYMDENLNEKENPYGLTEFDLEEIDELLNTDSK